MASWKMRILLNLAFLDYRLFEIALIVIPFFVRWSVMIR